MGGIVFGVYTFGSLLGPATSTGTGSTEEESTGGSTFTGGLYPIEETYTILGGEIFYPLVNSISFDNAIGQRGTCNFQVYDTLSTYSFLIGENIELYNSTNLLWSGVINGLRRRALTSTGVHWEISGISWNYGADKRRIVNTYVADHSSGYFHERAVQQGVIIESPDSNYTTDSPIIFYGNVPTSVVNVGQTYYITSIWESVPHGKDAFNFSTSINGSTMTWTITDPIYTDWHEYTTGTDGLTAGYIVNDIISGTLSNEGITAGTISSGAALGTCVFNYIKPSNAFDILAEQSGYIWNINPDKTLDFMPLSASTVCSTMNASQMKDVILTENNPKYRNTMYVIGGMELTMQATELQYGDGARYTYTTPFPIMKTPEISTVTVAGTSTQDVGYQGVDTTHSYFWQKFSNIVSQNATNTALGTTDYIKIVYYGGYPTVAVAQEEDAISALAAVELGTGLVEDTLQKGKETLYSDNLTIAENVVSKYATDVDTLTFKTLESGIEAGKLIDIDFPAFGITTAESFLVEGVRANDRDLRFEYNVTCIRGPDPGGWSKFFDEFFTRTLEKDIWAGSVSGDIVVVSHATSEGIAWSEAYIEAVTTCILPCSSNGALLASSTTFLC